jgi:hypothetical protein
MQSAAFAGGSKVGALQGALSPAPRRFHSLRMSAQSATSPICSDTIASAAFSQIVVGPAHEVARHDDAEIVIAGVKRGIENATIHETAVEHDRFDAHVTQQESRSVG